MQTILLIITLLLIIALGIVVYGSAVISSGIFVRAVCKLKAKDKVLLTFDDGPDPQNTPKVLDALDECGAKAIFFVVGKSAAKHPELIREIARRGHLIGNHTYNHSPYANFFGERHLELEIGACDDVVLAALGERPEKPLFRPPLGVTTHYMSRVLRKTGHTPFAWSVRSLDTLRSKSREWVVERVSRQLEGGSIVLLHDRMERADEVTRAIAQAVRDKGLKLWDGGEI